MDGKPQPDFDTLVSVTELMQLTNLGICVTEVTWPRVRISSDKWLCVRHNKRQLFECNLDSDEDALDDFQIVCKHSHNNTLSMVTALNAVTSETRSFAVKHSTSGQVNPSCPLIAISDESKICVRSLKSGKVLKWKQFPCDVHLWSWINEEVIGIVGSTQVYHWNVREDELEPFFSRDARLKDYQITSYQADPCFKWFALTGLSLENDDTVSGLAQIYSSDYSHSHCIETHACVFTRYKFGGNLTESSVLIAAKKSSPTAGKLSVVELGPSKPNNNPLISRIEPMVWTDATQESFDFPVALVCSPQLGVIYVMSKHGSIYVYELETATSILPKIRISLDIIFDAKLDGETQGVIALVRNGQVLLIDLHISKLLDYLNDTGKRSTADRISNSRNIGFSDEVTRL